jgi:predicted aminopeptidase
MDEGRKTRFTARSRKLLASICLIALAFAFGGCQTFGYYGQAIRGEYQILSHREPIQKLIAEPRTAPELREKLQLILQLRQFAKDSLHLPADDQYLRYVDLHRPFVVWNVHAAPEFALEPKTWWYPFVGSLKYRGYFSEAGARRYASSIEKKGWQVYVEGVEAYSTLGWFKDPLLNTFIFEPAPQLAETLFHELAHQRVFISGDTDFNEAFATAVGEEGVRRWLQPADNQNLLTPTGQEAKNALDGTSNPGVRASKDYEQYLAALQRNEQFVRIIMDAREKLDHVYKSAQLKPGKPSAPGMSPTEIARLRQQKELVITELRQDYARLKAEWNGRSDYDHWFAQSLNNAQLNTVAAYYDLVPGFRALLRKNNGDLEKFYREVSGLGKLQKDERRRIVKAAAEGLAERADSQTAGASPPPTRGE